MVIIEESFEHEEEVGEVKDGKDMAKQDKATDEIERRALVDGWKKSQSDSSLFIIH